jgi:YaiO family outer membrane protein
MQRNSSIRVVFFLLMILAIVPKAYAQSIKDPDSLFSMARKAAFDDKDHPTAISLSRQALAISPAYTDILVFLGRLYSWNKQADSARYYFNMALRQKPGYEDATAAYADLEFWNDNDSASLALLHEGLAANPASVELLIRKARVLESLKSYKAAATLADSILTIDKSHTEARVLSQRLQGLRSENRIGVKYDYVYIDKQFSDPWHLAAIDYTRQTKIGSFTARLNYANRFASNGLQYEFEGYPRFSKTFYSYVNLACSDNVGVFPHWRVGASLYANLPKAFEAEAGFRYLFFNTSTNIYTFYLGKYYSKFLFGARTYLVPNGAGTAQSYSGLVRYYFGGIDDYMHLSAGYGLSPDDRSSAYLYNLPNLRTYRGEAILRKAIKRMNIVTLNISLVNQEYLPNTIGNQLQAGIGYIRRF